MTVSLRLIYENTAALMILAVGSMGRAKAVARAYADEVFGVLARPVEVIDRIIPRAASVPLAIALAAAPLGYGIASEVAALGTAQRAAAYLASLIGEGNPGAMEAIKTYARNNFYYLSGTVVYSSRNATLSVDRSHSIYEYYNDKTITSSISVTNLNAPGLASELIGSIEGGNTYGSGRLMRMLGRTGFGYGTLNGGQAYFMLLGTLVVGAEVGMFGSDYAIRREALTQVRRAQEMLDERWSNMQGI